VFITGGASGIGAAMVEAFTGQGAVVGHCDLAAEAAETLADAIAAAGHARPWFRALDVIDTPALQQAISDFAAAAGGLDVLVNNVANDNRHDPLELMRGAGSGGAIINFSSITALLGPAEMPGYVTAKAGLLGLTKSFARRYGVDGIRVNTILPGWVVTQRQLDLWLTPEAEEEWMEQACLKQRIQPRDAANLALFLAADDSRMITNQQFVIDAGRV
jgi:NAD(P)-dependent dehydrogenase (short-subunit alcohol dehydrogenase family)